MKRTSSDKSLGQSNRYMPYYSNGDTASVPIHSPNIPSQNSNAIPQTNTNYITPHNYTSQIPFSSSSTSSYSQRAQIYPTTQSATSSLLNPYYTPYGSADSYNGADQNSRYGVRMPPNLPGYQPPYAWQSSPHPPLFNPLQPPPPLPTELPASSGNITQQTRGGRSARGRGRGGRYTNNFSNNHPSPGNDFRHPYNVRPAQTTITGFMESDLQDVGRIGITINKKSKRKPMSSHYTTKEWNKDDALKALALEKEINQSHKTPMLILKFPDPELNKEIIKTYSPFIENVHFQQPSTPRYCFVQLKVDADITKIKEELCKIPFGTGTIIAEHKNTSQEGSEVQPEDIDPYTIYVGNLPTNVSVKKVKSKFPNAIRIDIGFAQRMKFTRYAFVRYDCIEDAMTAYKQAFNLELGSRSLVVRFRRNKGNVGLHLVPAESALRGYDNEHSIVQEDELDACESLSMENVSETSSLLNDHDTQDSKANVLSDARTMGMSNGITRNNPPSQKINNKSRSVDQPSTSTETTSTSTVTTIKEEPNIRTKKSKRDSKNEPKLNLLGTKIKEEELELSPGEDFDNVQDSDDDFFLNLPNDDSECEEDFFKRSNLYPNEDDVVTNDEQYSGSRYWCSDLTPKRIKIEEQDSSTQKGNFNKVKINPRTNSSVSDDQNNYTEQYDLYALYDELNPDDEFRL